MEVTIDRKRCIGCELCIEIAPAVFTEDGDYAKVIIDEPSTLDDYEADARAAAEDCPVQAIQVLMDSQKKRDDPQEQSADEGRRTGAASSETEYLVSVALRWMVESASIEDNCRTLQELLGVDTQVLGEVVGVQTDVSGNVVSYSVKFVGENAGVVSMTPQEAGSLMPLDSPSRAKRYVIALHYLEVREAGSPAEAAAMTQSALPQWAVSTVGEAIDERVDPASGQGTTTFRVYPGG